MAKKTIKYYNYLVKVVTTDPTENRQIASNIDEWLGDTMANDQCFSGDDSVHYELVRFSERKKKKRKIK